MKNEKGFSLIELLAVIVLLAVIALIVIPAIGNVISDSRSSSFKESANGIKKAIEGDYTSQKFNTGLYYTYHDGYLTRHNPTATKEEDKEVDIPISGNQIGDGVGVIDSLGNITYAMYNGKECVRIAPDTNGVATIVDANDLNSCLGDDLASKLSNE